MSSFAGIVIVGEGVGSVLLLLPAWRSWGAGIAILLLGAFVVGQAIVLRQGRQIQCGCFGRSIDGERVGVSTLARTLLLLALGLVVLLTAPTPFHPLHVLGALLLMATGSVVIAILRTIYDLSREREVVDH